MAEMRRGIRLTRLPDHRRLEGIAYNHDAFELSDPEQISGTSHFSNDLGLDSLDTVEVVMAIEEVRR